MHALVVDDDSFLRVLLSRALDGVDGLLVHACASAAEAVTVARTHRPALLVADLDLGPGPTGIDLAHALRRQAPDLAVVVLSSYRDPRLLDTRVSLPDGAAYLSKQDVDDLDTLVDTVREVLAAPRGRRSGPDDVRIRGRRMSDNQLEIMRLVAEGYANAEIARRQSLTPAAVEKAIARLIRQLELKPTATDNARVLITQAYGELIGSGPARRESGGEPPNGSSSLGGGRSPS